MDLKGNDFRKLVLQAAEELTGQRFFKKDGDLIVDSFVLAVQTAIANGDSVKIKGFGRFGVHDYPGRKVRWVDGTERDVAPRRGVKFTPGTTLKRIAAQGIIRPAETAVK